MKGRKPQPSALKVLRGNPGRRPVNLAEPKHGALDPAVPVELVDAGARTEWVRVAVLLAEKGQVTTVDRATLLGYCMKYAQWQALEREAAAHPFLVRTPSGYPLPNPALGMANKAFALVLKAAAELGITPSSRSRVHAVEHAAPPTSKWAGLLK